MAEREGAKSGIRDMVAASPSGVLAALQLLSSREIPAYATHIRAEIRTEASGRSHFPERAHTIVSMVLLPSIRDWVLTLSGS